MPLHAPMHAPLHALGGYVREWSLLANPRTPGSVLGSAAEVGVAPDGGAAELARLRREFASTKVLACA